MFTFTEKKLKAFFSLFQKDVTNSELSLFLEGKGNWNTHKETQNHLDKIKKYTWVFRCVPGLQAVFFCNTTAFRAVNKSSDIDVFIITDDKLLWTTRIFITLFTHILGVRRHGNKIASRFCLSFFATETGAFYLEDLQIQKNKDPYLAVWAASLECFVAQKNFIENFRSHNTWIKNYELHWTQNNIKNIKTPFFITNIFSILFKVLFIEKILYLLFFKRTQKKAELLKHKSGTIISEIYLKFHNEDIRGEIYEKIKEL